jgi:hypothetical protein
MKFERQEQNLNTAVVPALARSLAGARRPSKKFERGGT